VTPGTHKSRSRWEAAPKRRDSYQSSYAVEATSSLLAFGMPVICTSDKTTREHIGAFPPCTHRNTRSFHTRCIVMVTSV